MAESMLWTALFCALILRLGWHHMHLSALPSWMLLIPGGRHFPGWERWGWSIKGMLIAKWAGKSVVSWNLVPGSPEWSWGGRHFKGGYVTPERKSYASSCLVSWNLAAMDLKGSQMHWMLLKPGRNSFLMLRTFLYVKEVLLLWWWYVISGVTIDLIILIESLLRVKGTLLNVMLGWLSIKPGLNQASRRYGHSNDKWTENFKLWHRF